MSRGSFYHDPARKHIEQYQDFSGGLNTVSSNDNTLDNELTTLENANLGDRGSLTRRKGFQSERNLDASGKPQGLFRFHRRFTPYNLLDVEGSFDGIKKQNGTSVSIGGWYVFNMPNEADAYKVDREKSKELIVNGDFENGSTGWHLTIKDMDVGDSLVGPSINSHSGKNVFRIRSFKGHSGYINEYQDWDNEFDVNPGETIRFETMVRRAAVSVGNVPYRAHLIVSIRRTSGARERHYFNEYHVNSDWKKIQGSLVMPSDAVSVVVGLGILDKDISQDIAAYFDDVQLFRRTVNRAVNGGFEEDETGWDLIENDTKEAVMGTSINAHSGTRVLRIRNFKGTDGYTNVYQKEEHDQVVKEGDKIQASVYHRIAALSVGAKPYQAHMVASVLLKDGSRERTYVSSRNVTADWQRISAEFIMPKNAISVRIGIGIKDNNKGTDVAAYFDEVRINRDTQMIYNGDFELGEKGWHLDVTSLTAGDSVVGASDFAPSGKSVLRIRRHEGHGGFYNEYQSFKNEIEAKAGETIYAEALYRRAAIAIGDIPYRIHLIASVKKKDGSRERFYINKYDVDSTWKKVTGYFKMPKDTVSVVFGVGLYDISSERNAAVYFDDIYARKEIEGATNSAVAIRSTSDDTRKNRGLGYRYNGMESHKYYIYVVDFRASSKDLKGGLAVRDERYGVGSPAANTVIEDTTFSDDSDEWVTKYMKFKTGEGITQARAYVYNYSELGVIGTVYYDNARIYEISADQYYQIDDDPEYTGEAIGEKFPYLIGKLSSELLIDTVTAIGGKFYVNGTEMPVEDGIGIQSERSMEAASYGNNLYIASGTELLVYNGSTIATVDPYIPDPLETLYIGSNAKIDNPYQINDEEQSVVELLRLQFSRRYGVTNQDITLRVGVGKPSNVIIEYKFERRNVRDKEDYWETIQDWGNENEVTFKTNIAGEYQFKVSVRKKDAEVTLDDYEIPKYIVKPTEDENDIPIDGNTINLCNRILIHWDRLILYGDEAKPDVVYISDLYNPGYFPINNTLQFENPRRERITSIIKYRDALAIFTPTSIQALHGTNPENYERYMLNTDVGSIADRSPSVVQNHIMFLSYEGVTVLKSVGTSETKSNVSVIDTKITNLVELTEDAISYVRNNQYCLVFPSHEKQLRYYYEWGVWAMDRSPSLDFIDANIESTRLYALGSDGRIITDSERYVDEENYFYDMKIGTKLFSFDEPYATKKTRETQIMFDQVEQETSLDIYTYMDKLYQGKREIPAVDFDREITKSDVPNHQYWITEVTPSHSDTIKKDFGKGEFDGGREVISAFANRNKAIMVYSGSGALSNGKTQGLQIKDGEVYQIRNKGQRYYETLAVMEDGSFKIIDDYDDEKDPDIEDVKHTFHFGPYMIKDGVKREDFTELKNYDTLLGKKHPRQAIGQRADGTIVIITVDGRSDVAEGMTIEELADLFEQQECVVAYNLDGGGSAQSYVDGQRLNVYSDGAERVMGDFMYFTKDVVEIVEGSRDGLIKTDTININPHEDIYKVPIPGKGITVGTLLSHKEDKLVKLVGLGYIFKLKKP